MSGHKCGLRGALQDPAAAANALVTPSSGLRGGAEEVRTPACANGQARPVVQALLAVGLVVDVDVEQPFQNAPVVVAPPFQVFRGQRGPDAAVQAEAGSMGIKRRVTRGNPPAAPGRPPSATTASASGFWSVRFDPPGVGSGRSGQVFPAITSGFGGTIENSSGPWPSGGSSARGRHCRRRPPA